MLTFWPSHHLWGCNPGHSSKGRSDRHSYLPIYLWGRQYLYKKGSSGKVIPFTQALYTYTHSLKIKYICLKLLPLLHVTKQQFKLRAQTSISNLNPRLVLHMRQIVTTSLECYFFSCWHCDWYKIHYSCTNLSCSFSSFPSLKWDGFGECSQGDTPRCDLKQLMEYEPPFTDSNTPPFQKKFQNFAVQLEDAPTFQLKAKQTWSLETTIEYYVSRKLQPVI